MGDWYLGDIRLFARNGQFIPRGWAECNGAILQISSNQALYAVIGKAYGGDGTKTFALPDLRGRVAVGFSQSYLMGTQGGSETVALTAAQGSPHTHPVFAANSMATKQKASGDYFAQTQGGNVYAAGSGVSLAPQTIANTGGGAGHENRQPWLALVYCIAVQGLFPQRA